MESRRSILAIFLCGLVLAGCGQENSSLGLPSGSQDSGGATRAPDAAWATEVTEGAPLVVFLGDSITAGLHLARDEGFPAVLQQKLAAENLPFRVVNAGVSGDTSSGGVRRIDWVLQQKPDVVVVELGGNDGLRGLPLAMIEENLDRILTRAKEAGARVLLLGMRLPPSYGAEYTEGFAAIYTRLAQKHAVELVPFFMQKIGGVPDLNLEDGLHPNAKGHDLLAQAVLPYLRKVLGPR